VVRSQKVLVEQISRDNKQSRTISSDYHVKIVQEWRREVKCNLKSEAQNKADRRLSVH